MCVKQREVTSKDCFESLERVGKFHMKDSKSCIINFCHCSFRGVFKELRANFLPSSYIYFNEPSS